MLTFDQMNEAFADADEDDVRKYYDAFNAACEEFEINTPQRLAAFIAQVAHESGNLSTITENLNYSSQRLIQVFPKYFRNVDASAYHRQPEKIANLVYANRMGNGPPESGDGYRYRGRGLIQLTGKDNYTRCGEDLEVDLINNPDYLLTPEGACRSAAWFWDSRNLNNDADKNDIITISKKVNGGTIGLHERIENYNHALSVLKG